VAAVYARSMVNTTTAAGEAGLAAIINDSGRALLAFDFDGVLSPIVDDPGLAQPFPGIFDALASLGRSVGSIAIITGRPVSFMISRNGFDALATTRDLTIYGQYGLERWDAQSQAMTTRPVNGGIAVVREELAGLLQQPGMPDGAWIEDKGNAVAVHTRRTADPAAALEMISQPVRDIAGRHHLHVEPGRMVLELRPHGMHKGDVLREIVTGKGMGSVLYAGDDLGDLSAFAVVDELRADGVPGVKVCSASTEAPEVAAAADLVVDGPPGIGNLLGDIQRQIKQASPRVQGR
jgi:trehalose 6-phosphate phosphatase